MSQANMRADLRSHLLSSAALVNLVGTRIYADQAMQNDALPYVVNTVISIDQSYTHSGRDVGRETLLQFDVVGETPTQTEQVSDALKDAMSGKRVTKGNTVFGYFFESTERSDLTQTSSNDGSFGPYLKTLDMRVGWQPISTL